MSARQSQACPLFPLQYKPSLTETITGANWIFMAAFLSATLVERSVTIAMTSVMGDMRTIHTHVT